MTPYEIGVLLHYHYSPEDHPDLDNQPPVWRPTMDAFKREGLIEAAVGRVCYRLTDKGRCYVVDGLCNVPLPVSRWSIPKAAA